MMFVCCHPSLERKSQIALTLKTLCGFGISEIARGLLLPAETVKKRIQRAKKSLANANVTLELPRADQLTMRREVVHDVLYLMFNEGYSTSLGTEPIRDDICEEAARLCHLLCESSCSSSSTNALLAMMLFHAARLDARTDTEGAVVLLEDQDRTSWDRRLIGMAQFWLAKSKTDQPTTFHFEAAIAMQHCISPSVEATDWETIVRFYTRLLQLHDSPIYALNRAIAFGQTGNTDEALRQLQSLRSRSDMKNYLLLDCAFARIHELEGDTKQAVDACLVALSKATAPHEKQLLDKKLRKLRINKPTSDDVRCVRIRHGPSNRTISPRPPPIATMPDHSSNCPRRCAMSSQHDNPWQTRSSQLRFENPWIRIVQNEVINPSGGPGEYTVVHFKNRAVAVIPLDEENHTWLVGQYRYATESFEWEIPEGGAPEGESILECAKRELAEETGLTATSWTLISADLQLSNSVTDERGYTYLARGLSQSTAAPEETEQLHLRRLPLEEAIDMAVRGEITDAFSVVSLFRLQQKMLRGEIAAT